MTSVDHSKKPVHHPKPAHHAAHHAEAHKAAHAHEAQHADPHVAAHPAAVAKKATHEVQHAARQKFAHAAPTPAEAKKAADHSIHAVNAAATAIGTAHSDDAQRKATLKATQTLSRELSNKTHDERRQILEKTHAAMGAIGKGLDKLDGDQTKKAVSDLTSAAEAAGPKLAKHITDPIAHALPQSLAGDGDNKGELTDGIKSAVGAGKGAVFATSLAQSARDVPGLKSAGVDKDIGDAANEAIGDAQKNFTDANKKANLLDARLAVTVEQWKKSGALSPDGIQAGIDAYKQAHHDDYAAADNASRVLANTLPGAGLASHEAGDLGDTAREALEQVPAIAQRDAGAKVLASAIEHNSPFLDDSKRLLGEGPNAKAQLEGYDNAILRSVSIGGPDLVKHGERERLSSLVAGAARAVNDKKLHSALQQYHDKIDALPPDLTGVALGQQLASTATSIAKTSLESATTSAGSTSTAAPRLQAVGAALGLGALAQNVATLDPKDVKSVLGAAGSATSSGISIAELAGKSLGKASLAVGAAFSTFQVGASLAKGDVGGAAAASLPLAGLAIGAVVGGPVGAGLGLAAGGIAQTAISLFGSHDSPDEVQEKAVDPFLQGAFKHDHIPNAETAAYRLRDVYTDGNTFTGVGDSLGKLAKARGQTPHQLLHTLARMPSENLKQVTTKILDARKTASRDDDADVVDLIGEMESLGTQELPDWG